MTGRSLYGGLSREIPAQAFATFRFFDRRDGVDCLGPPDLADADCWRDLALQADQVRAVWPKDARTPMPTTPPRRRGRPPKKQTEVRTYLERKYPAGLPDDMTIPAFSTELAAANINASDDTIRRVLNRK
jgi:hypothetical protein